MRSGRFTKMTMGFRWAILSSALVAALAAVGVALAGPAVPTPSMTSQPPNPTNQTSAHFTYGDSQRGVTYQCQLDAAAFASCPSSGITYAGPLAQGSHTFKVQAVAGTKTSSTASYTWTIDLTPPTLSSINRVDANPTNASPLHWTVSFSKPVKNVSAANFGFATGNVTGTPSISSVAPLGGSAPQPSWTVTVSTAGMTGQNSGSIGLNLANKGSIQDAAGNPLSTGGFTGQAYTFDTTPPPRPSITSGPEATTTAKTATFAFTDSEAGVSFLCRLDGGSFSACSSPTSDETGTQGEHTFSVEARDAAGNVSVVTSYSWTVVKNGQPKSFTINGSLPGLLSPGVSRPLPLTISNPNNVQIYVTSLTVSVQPGSTKPGCDGPTNLQVTPSSASSTNALTVSAYGQVTLPAGPVSAPQVLMKNLSSNQDACKGASFTFTYSGIAHS
ncbi:MAG TPA: hypothetical protein VHS55_05625 [Solirubrobacteraceae bacterium]|nr:hypothetical protein [Solirubrobacteraceae bacterium]